MKNFCIIIFLIFFDMLTCSADYKKSFVDENGKPIDFELPVVFKTDDAVCDCIYFDHIHYKAKFLLKESLDLLERHYLFEVPFTREHDPDKRYLWDQPGRSYHERYQTFWLWYFTTDLRISLFNMINKYSEYAERYRYLQYWLNILLVTSPK